MKKNLATLNTATVNFTSLLITLPVPNGLAYLIGPNHSIYRTVGLFRDVVHGIKVVEMY